MGRASTYETLTQVRPNLFIGGYRAASDPQLLAKNKIDVVVSMIGAKETPRFAGIDHACMPAQDLPGHDIREAAVAAATYALQKMRQGRTVLVHCHAGISRSATVVLLILMAQGEALKTALADLKARRPQVQPNAGFMKLLANVSKQIDGKLKARKG